jgi:hypothetical protein
MILLIILLIIILIWVLLRYTNNKKQKNTFWETMDVVKILVNEGEVSKTAYENTLCAFREFNSIAFRDDKAYKKLFADFLFKYRDFLPGDKIKTIPE